MMTVQNMPDEWSANNCYVLIFNEPGRVISAYSSPFKIVNYMWREAVSLNALHTERDHMSWMRNIAIKTGMTLWLSRLDEIAKGTPTRWDIEELCFLFLASYAITFSGIGFGWAQIPEQTPKLVTFLDSFMNVYEPYNYAVMIIQKTPIVGEASMFLLNNYAS